MCLPLVGIELQGVDHLRDAIEQGAPAQHQHGHTGRSQGLDDDIEADEEDDRWEDPVAEAYLAIPAGIDEVHVLVNGSQNQDGANDIHQGLDEDVGRQCQQKS